MTGIEKIIAKIEDNCKIICDDIIGKANAEAQKILDNAEIEGANAKEDAIQAAKSKCQTDIELANSKAEHERKKAILATKISIINEVIDESMKKLKSLPDADYFNAITLLINRFAQKGHGVLRFSKNDINRMPKDFEATINDMLRSSERSVEISETPIDIDGGFIIIYNEIELNCTFDSLLNASLEEIKDELYEEIFMRENI